MEGLGKAAKILSHDSWCPKRNWKLWASWTQLEALLFLPTALCHSMNTSHFNPEPKINNVQAPTSRKHNKILYELPTQIRNLVTKFTWKTYACTGDMYV